MDKPEHLNGNEIAIIGMACRFPGAPDVETYWRNLRAGVESLSELSDEQLRRAGVPPEVYSRPEYVRRVPLLDGVELFDAEFFGYTPLEALLMDPQQRLFMECTWEALERAGYAAGSAASRDGAAAPRIGVYTGAKTNTYLFNIVRNRELFAQIDSFQIALGNDLAAMATRLSYKLDLRGPSYAIHTACSTSLVAVHLACQSLLLDECSLAVAGGAAINVPQERGYLYQTGGILSRDGSCRTFDAAADGSNFGNGVGAVVLKRLDDALADGDHVHAVIKGSATNNDGARKASFTAPGVEGQTEVILEALAVAGVAAADVDYVEAHGTATELGDSIEMLALTQAFGAEEGEAEKPWLLGSAKTNLGHLETAAGVAGLIKTALALEREELPPSLHFSAPSPRIDFRSGPFEVNAELTPWPRRDERPRRAGVSSFGIGSTNAHVIVEEAPRPVATTPSRPWQLLLLSARTESALDTAGAELARHLEEHPEQELADAAFTLQVGRRRFRRRRALVARDAADAAAVLAGGHPERLLSHDEERAERPLVFLFPGLGEHYPGMARGLYDAEPAFRRAVDDLAARFEPHVGVDLRQVIFAGGEERGAAAAPDLRRMLGRGGQGPRRDAGALSRTSVAQPAMFLLEYALAELWSDWGLAPEAMIGYSLGEYVAAARAGVFRLDDAVALVAERAKLIDALPAGAMLALPLGEEEVLRRLAERAGQEGEGGEAGELSLAAVNGPRLSVVAGAPAAVQAWQEALAAEGVACRPLDTTHAFHSAMMQPIAAAWAERVGRCELSPPSLPFVSNVTGTWITDAEATDPAYWAAHLRRPVRFADGVAALLAGPPRALVEVGPGQSLGSFVKLHPDCDGERAALTVSSLPGAFEGGEDLPFLLTALGRLWLAGAAVDWHGFHAGERRRRVPLPTYPFERKRHWVDPDADGGMLGDGAALAQTAGGARRVTLDKQPDVADWFYRPTWSPAASAAAPADEELARSGPWLIFCDPPASTEGAAADLGGALARRLREAGAAVDAVHPGNGFAAAGDGLWELEPGQAKGYAELFRRLAAADRLPRRVLHLWSWGAWQVAAEADGEPDALARFDAAQERGLYSLIFLAQGWGRTAPGRPLDLTVVSSGVQRVGGEKTLAPERATLLGPAKVIPQELPGVTCRSVDVAAAVQGDAADELAAALLAEAAGSPAADAGAADPNATLALRGGERFVESFEAAPLPAAEGRPERLRQGGVYVITGGLGGLGLELAEHLVLSAGARLVLTRRSPLPPRDDWDDYLADAAKDDATAVLLRRLLAFEEAGGEVLAVAADAADPAAMAAVRDAALARFGAVHGVVHMAGVPGGGILQLKTRQAADAIVSPKARGALVTEQTFAALDLDFLLFYSSIASVLGEFGQADYCGANAFLDALAVARHGGDGPPVSTVDWDVWRDVGLAVHTEVPEHLKAWRREMLEQAMLPAEGLDAFDRLLAAGAPRTVVSAQPLAGRIELGRQFTGENFLAELARAQAPAGVPGSGDGKVPGTGSGAASRRALGTAFAAASGSLERRIAAVWERVLGLEQVGVRDNFFDLGGNSLVGLQLVTELSRELEVQIAPVTLFESPTVAALARHLDPGSTAASAGDELAERRRRLRAGHGAVDPQDRRIAVVALTGRFPGAASVEALWDNLAAGVESITFFSDEELAAAGLDPALYGDPRYVRAGAVLEGIETFDATLFGYSPREAEVMDPQHKVFLECSWEALELAGYDSSTYAGSIGVFAGSNLSTYLLQLHADPQVRGSVNMLQAILGNDKDSLTTTVSYKLDLRGPSVAVQTFCSTSLVAVHMAMQSLRSGECDMALAGGVRIVTPHHQGYLYEDGGIAPRDGHARSFAAGADGSVLGNGVGVVVLKRLSDALADGDPIHAVLLGSGLNNDGSLKAGYTAPSVAGQAAAVEAAYEDAGVEPGEIDYLEAHGSATELGDPIEVTALTRAFRRWTEETGYCRIGSVKSNLGHLDRAAGVTGLIKTVLSLQHGEIPPSINFERPNPKIDFAASPFVVAAERADWPRREERPRRAAVNSLGMGGTNVHVVVEEAPQRSPAPPGRAWKLLPLSAKTEAALDAATAEMGQWLGSRPEAELADAAWTLQVGRRALEHRRIAVCRDPADAAAVLSGDDPRRLSTAYCAAGERSVAFLLPGLGGQYVGMARGLYESEPVFRATLDRCAEVLREHLERDLREVLYPPAKDGEGADGAGSEQGKGQQGAGEQGGLDLRRMLRRGDAEDAPSEAERTLNRTLYTQPALFAVQVALAELLASWGVRPAALIGYSLGEYVAATLAGVLSLEDALVLVARRAKLIDALPAGALLAVALAEDEVRAQLGDELSLMAVNAPEQSVVSGPPAAVETLQATLQEAGVACRRLPTTHAFHSAMMQPIADDVAALAEGLTLSPPRVPYLSNVTGTWIRDEEATDPAYWARHLCQPVRFAAGLGELLAESGRVLVEVGPAGALSSLVHQQRLETPAPPVVSALRHGFEQRDDQAWALEALGRLWLAGVAVDWQGLRGDEERRRMVLPTYPFERRRYFIDTVDLRGRAAPAAPGRDGLTRFYAPSWHRAVPASPLAAAGEPRRWLLRLDDGGPLGELLAAELRAAGDAVAVVRGGDGDGGRDAAPAASPAGWGGEHRLAAQDDPDAWAQLLVGLGAAPTGAVHLAADGAGTPGSLLALGGGLDAALPPQAPRLPLVAVASGLVEVSGVEELHPEAAGLLGVVKVLSRHFPRLAGRAVDVAVRTRGEAALRAVARRLAAELAVAVASPTREPLVALRGGHRWVPGLERLAAEPAALPAAPACLVSGALGELAFGFLQRLATDSAARLAVVLPPGFPAEGEWDDWLAGATSRAASEAASDLGSAAVSVLARHIEGLRAVRAAGGELLTLHADLADVAAARRVVEEAEARFGALAGWLHVSDVGERSGLSAAAADDAYRRAVSAPRVLGEALRGRDLAFRLLVSAAAVPDGPGATVAEAVGAALDALAADRRRDGERWLSVAWNRADDAPTAPTDGALVARLAALGGCAQVVVADRSLGDRWLRLTAFREAAAPGAGSDGGAGGDGAGGAGGAAAAVGYYPRPSLRVEYVAPEGPTQEAIARIWRDLLGVERIGVHDNFLELGGDSLLASRLVTRMREVFALDLPIRLLFEASTIGELTVAVEERRRAAEESEVADLLARIQDLSEEELEQEILRREGAVQEEVEEQT